ncbi:SAM-dependent methyltransferase, partial [Phocaeicola coprophilus]|nr:SAM-dependent methyltransferase [Phocaeicola coprophilus]
PIGDGKSEFTVNFKKPIPKTALLTSTSLALGEAYMDGDLEIEGDLYYALDHFLGQMGKFSANASALKKLVHSSVSKKNQKKEVTSHYD